MASFSTSSTHNWGFSLKVVFISTGVLSMAMALRLSLPVLSDFLLSEAPSFWNVLLTWLRPPYLYILMNTIIISLFASSKLQQHKLHDAAPSPDTLLVPVPPVTSLSPEPLKIPDDLSPEYAVYTAPDPVVLPPVQSIPPEPVKISGDIRMDYASYNGVVSNGYVYDANVPEKLPESQQPMVSNIEKTPSYNKISSDSGDAILTPNSNRTSLQRKDSMDFAFPNENEKPPVSARFSHRRAVKASPEGGKAALRVSKPKRQDTLESTWKTITEGRAMPLTRHLKKSNTWDSHLRRNAPLTDQNGGTPPNPKLVKKPETFSGRSTTSASPSPASGKLRKEPSPGQDELNRRVEAFIRKFNEDMRLQRQESLRQYQEMISRGAH